MWNYKNQLYKFGANSRVPEREKTNKQKTECISKTYMVEATSTKSLGVKTAKKRTQSKKKALN